MRKLLLAGTALLVLAASPASAAIVGNLGPNPTSKVGAFADPNLELAPQIRTVA